MPIRLIVDGITTTPRAFAEKVLTPKMVGDSNEDITVVRVEVCWSERWKINKIYMGND